MTVKQNHPVLFRKEFQSFASFVKLTYGFQVKLLSMTCHLLKKHVSIFNFLLYALFQMFKVIKFYMKIFFKKITIQTAALF